MKGPKPSLSIAERVDAACDQFEAEWNAGRRPMIDEYLRGAPESDREELRRALFTLVAELSGRDVAKASTTQPYGPVQNTSSPSAMVDGDTDSDAGAAAIGRFTIRGILGSGAFGKVYRAFDPRLGREVALKVPVEDDAATESERSLFLKEARAAATINHPNVCQIHEVGEHGGRPYIVMPLIPGQSLADALKGRTEPLPAKQAAHIVRKIALGLAAAHDKGIVHRDLKPANVMYDRERKDVIVMDFGLAHGARFGGAPRTQSGVVMGTPAYMSPEQARGESKGVGPASDVFSLGIIMYELLTGTRPFRGTAAQVIGDIVRVDPEPPSQRRADVDPRLEAVCLKAMAKDPTARFVTMREFAAAIDAALRPPALESAAAEALAGASLQTPGKSNPDQLAEFFAALSAERKQPQAAPAAVPRRRTPTWLLAVGGLACGLVALGGALYFNRSNQSKTPTPPPNAKANNTEKGSRGQHDVMEVAKPLIKPSPLDVLKAADIPDAVLTKVYGGRDKAPSELVAIFPNLTPNPDEDYKGFAISPDSRTLAASHSPWDMIELFYLDEGQRYRQELGIEEPRNGRPHFYWVGFSADGKTVFGVRLNHDLHAFDLKGTELWRTPTLSNRSAPAVSPDGSTIIVAAKEGSDLRVLDARTGQERSRWKGVIGSASCRLNFSPDGKTLVIGIASQLNLVGARDGKEIKMFPFTDSIDSQVFNHDGTKIFTSHSWNVPEDHVTEVDLATSKKREYRLPSKGCQFAVANPALPILVTIDREERIHFWDSDAGPAQRPLFVSVGSPVERLLFTPDGHYLVVGCDNGIFVFRIPVEEKVADWIARRTRTRSTQDELSRRQAPSFSPLFNGKDLTGWKVSPKGSDVWTVEDGLLTGRSEKKLHYLFTERSNFTDFHLRAVARVNQGGNSGISIRTAYDVDHPRSFPGYPGGYEVQILHEHPEPNTPLTGSIMPPRPQPLLRAVHVPPVKANEWFTLEVIARETSLSVLVNGVEVARAEDGTYDRGQIALQTITGNFGISTVVQFKSIEVEEFPR